MGRTSIQVSDELADELALRKRRGDSYEDVIWRLIDRAGDSPTHSADEKAPTETREPGGGEPPAEAQDYVEADRGRLRGALAGSGDLLERRVDAIQRMYEYLQEHGEAEKNELLSVVDADTVRYDHLESVWSNMVRGKDTLSGCPGVETPPTGRSEWRYTG